MPASVVRAVIKVESNYQERARSNKGAMGLMQLMPETARRYAVADPYEPRANIEAGIKHLRSLLDRFELPLALAAYNAGEAAVLRFGGIPPVSRNAELRPASPLEHPAVRDGGILRSCQGPSFSQPPSS